MSHDTQRQSTKEGDEQTNNNEGDKLATGSRWT